jgi:hypothetical protein
MYLPKTGSNWSAQMDLIPLRTAEKVAEIAYLEARIDLLKAELAEANAAHPPGDGWRAPDLAEYNPAWKTGIHLSPPGIEAILNAFDQHMRVGEVAALFQISERAAGDWYRRWQERRKASRS